MTKPKDNPKRIIACDLTGMSGAEMALAIERLVFTAARGYVRRITVSLRERTIIADALRGIHRED
jgi:hypothetical protein